MALYSYHAFSKDGKKINGQLDAPSLEAVKEQLVKQGMFPITVQLATGELQGSVLQRFFKRKITTKDKILFTNQLVVLLKSGVPLLQALELLVEQLQGQLRSIVVAIKDDIKQGASFADALAKFPRVFETLYVQLVRAGEASGNLEPILKRLSEYIERTAATKKKVRNALMFPLIQLTAAVLVVIGLINFVVPKIAEGLATEGKDLPMLTQFMVDLAGIFSNYYLVMLGVLIFSVAGYRYWASTTKGAYTLDVLKLRLPLVRHIAKMNAVVQFCYTLGMLLEGGVNLADALDIVCAVIDNKVLTGLLKEARDKIVKQGKIAQYLKQTNIFPAVAIYLIKTGEESGQLHEMLLSVADNQEVELNELIDQLTGSVGPIMLIIIGLLIGLIILSVMLPIFNMMESINV